MTAGRTATHMPAARTAKMEVVMKRRTRALIIGRMVAVIAITIWFSFLRRPTIRITCRPPPPVPPSAAARSDARASLGGAGGVGARGRP